MKLIIYKHKWLIALTIILTVLTSLAYVYIAVILQNVTDTALSGNYQTFYKVLILSVSYLILIGSINLIASLCTKKFIANCIKSLRINIFKKIIGYNTEKYMKVNTADYLSAFTNDITLIEQNYLLPLFSVLQNSVTFLGAVIMLFIISPLIAGILIGFLLLTIIIPSLFGKVLQKRQDRLSKSLSAFTSKTKDLLSGFDVIRSFGIQKQILAQFEYKNNVVYQSRYQSDKVTAISESIAEILAYFTLFSGIFIGAFLVMKGQISVGTLLALIQLSSALVNPLMVGMQVLTMIQGTKPILDRLEGFMNYEETEFCGRAIPTFNKRIELKQVSFSYSKDKKVIDCVNFIFEKNKKYAIVGKSGCGKSTLVKLLTANYGSYEGEILYDNHELHHLNIVELPQKSAMIHQNVYLFDDTVKDNICLYQALPDVQLERAISVSGVNHFENELPEKRMTKVGEGGNRLSGGQRQRVAVARALIQEKPFLILDEGTSAIDMKTAYEIESSLLAEKELTLITITHNMRREILEQYDVIIFMEGGKIIQAGSFDDLAETCKTFKDFLHINPQNRNKNPGTSLSRQLF